MSSYYWLAPLNSILNSVAAILLLCGFIFIRKGRVRAHRACMISAVIVSTAFFISYLIYHYHVGDVRFQGHGIVRPSLFHDPDHARYFGGGDFAAGGDHAVASAQRTFRVPSPDSAS